MQVKLDPKIILQSNQEYQNYTTIIKNMIITLSDDSNKVTNTHWVNTLRLRQNGRHFPDNIFKCIFLNENWCISMKISLKFVPQGLVNNIPALVQIMAWCRSGDKPLSEPMMVSLSTHICVTRPQWVNTLIQVETYVFKPCVLISTKYFNLRINSRTDTKV